MLQKTRGILLHRIYYSETSIIIRVYTEQAGLQAYILKGVRSNKSKIKIGFLQPLALIEIESFHHPKKNLQHIKEIRPSILLTNIPFNIYKRTIILFLNEVLNKCLIEAEPDRNLFEFIYYSIALFDLQRTTGTIFHMLFLMKLSMHLGFYPKENFSEQNCYFNMAEGSFCDKQGEMIIGFPYSQYFYLLVQTPYEDMKKINIPDHSKLALIDYLLQYYSHHLPSFGNIKSHKILHEVFH